MEISAPSDLFAVLATARPDAVLGTAESSWLDFKGAPYRLDEDDEKLELAKDVTALANSGGGVILVGYKTRKEPSTAREIADGVLPVRPDLVDFDRYQKVVEERTFPPLRHLNLRWWPSREDPRVFSIEVPAAADSTPVLVTRVKEEGSRRELLFGVFQRSGDRVSRITAGELHAWIQMGRAAQRGGLPALAPQATAATGPSDQQRLERRSVDTRDASLENHRHYFLQAWPLSKTEVQGLHRRDPTGLRSILSRPHEIRPTGFGLRTGLEPSVLPGGGLRVLREQRSSLSLERNGLLTSVITAGSEFLAWADEQRGRKYNINPIALVESTLEFARLFIFEVLPRCDPPVAIWRLAGGMAHLHEDNEPSSLPLGARLQFASEAEAATTSDFEFGPMDFGKETPNVVAFRVLREIYPQFGIDNSDIPYVELDEVSERLIQQAG